MWIDVSPLNMLGSNTFNIWNFLKALVLTSAKPRSYPSYDCPCVCGRFPWFYPRDRYSSVIFFFKNQSMTQFDFNKRIVLDIELSPHFFSGWKRRRPGWNSTGSWIQTRPFHRSSNHVPSRQRIHSRLASTRFVLGDY